MTAPKRIAVLPPLSLYIHIPWCVRKCPYCDFNSHTVKASATKKAGLESATLDQQGVTKVEHHTDTLPEDAYIDALIEDLKADTDQAQGRLLQSIFFGGGTPSLMSAQGIKRILDAAKMLIGFEPDIEITLEANPGTVEQEKFNAYYQAGVNRLSIGIQSFDPQQLTSLGRIHSSEEAKRAIQAARNAGFDNFNIDLMHGLPGQTPEQALADLRQAIELKPPHLSWYQLTIEPNTEYYRRPPELPQDELLADIQQAGEDYLAAHGFGHYEISAFSQDNHESKHNLNYWQFGDYIGIGAGAHGKNTLLKADTGKQITRRWKTRLPEHYLTRMPSIKFEQAKPEPSADIIHRSTGDQTHDSKPFNNPFNNPFSAGETLIATDELVLEYMMNVLRLRSGVERTLMEERTGIAEVAIKNELEGLAAQGLLEEDQTRLRLTETGHRFLNDVLARFSD
jgi:oxygen-independent coproporphyrinogen-3 oxidase